MPIYAYDRFTIFEKHKKQQLYPAGVPPFEGEDTLSLAQNFLRPWSEDIEFVVGDISKTGWLGDDISILVVDAGKRAADTDAIAEQFYPSLIADASYLVHQDFLQWNQPWICAQMYLMRDWFAPICMVPKNTVVFKCKKRPTKDDMSDFAIAAMSDDHLVQMIEAYRKDLHCLEIDQRLADLILSIRCNPSKRVAHGFANRIDR